MLLRLRPVPYCTPPSMPLECSHQNFSLHSIHRFAHAETLIPLVCFLGLFRDKEPLLPTNFEGKENCTIILPTGWISVSLWIVLKHSANTQTVAMAMALVHVLTFCSWCAQILLWLWESTYCMFFSFFLFTDMKNRLFSVNRIAPYSGNMVFALYQCPNSETGIIVLWLLL